MLSHIRLWEYKPAGQARLSFAPSRVHLVRDPLQGGCRANRMATINCIIIFFFWLPLIFFLIRTICVMGDLFYVKKKIKSDLHDMVRTWKI